MSDTDNDLQDSQELVTLAPVEPEKADWSLVVSEYTPMLVTFRDLEKYRTAVFDLSTTKGDKFARQVRKKITEVISAIEAKRVELKRALAERGRSVDAEAETLETLARSLKENVDQQIKADEKKKADEKAERERKENERVSAIKAKIEAVRRIPTESYQDSSEEIQATIDEFRENQPTSEEFQEFLSEAQTAMSGVFTQLQQMYEHALNREKEKVELDKLRAENEARRIADEEKARLAAEEAKQAVPIIAPVVQPAPAQPEVVDTDSSYYGHATNPDLTDYSGTGEQGSPAGWDVAEGNDTGVPDYIDPDVANSAPEDEPDNALASDMQTLAGHQFQILSRKVSAAGFYEFAAQLQTVADKLMEGEYFNEISNADMSVFLECDNELIAVSKDSVDSLNFHGVQ